MRAEAERIISRCRELARISDVAGETTRTFLSAGMRRANALVAEWMETAGLRVWTDAAGNLRGVRGGELGARLVLGSHLDTVVNAGAFDGPLGVVLAIEAVAALRGKEPGYAVEVLAFSEEEGVRFGAPFLGSRAVVGTLDGAALAVRDAAGVSVEEAIREYGLDACELPAARLAAGTFAYVEVHLEQGPVLDGEGKAVAAVSAIAGQSRLRVRFDGQANHAGTTPMAGRRDALAAAAEWIGEVEAAGLAGTDGLVATVGAISVEPGLGNVVAGVASASLDVRHAVDATRKNAVERMLVAARRAGLKRGVEVSFAVMLEQPAVAMDEGLTRLLGECAAVCGFAGEALVSGAGHDAMILAPHVPAAMLFVRTPDGVSHHPAEMVRVEDAEAALATTMEFLRRLRPEGAGASHG